MSFQEKSTWIMGVLVAIVYGWYFATVIPAATDGDVTNIDYQGLMLLTVVVLVVAAVIGHIVVAVADPKGSDQSDERDRTINRTGEYIGGFVLGLGALLAMGMAMVEIHQFWIANTILAALVLSELVSAGTKLVLYRRGV